MAIGRLVVRLAMAGVDAVFDGRATALKELEEEIRKYVTEIEVFEENTVEMRGEIKKLKYKNAILQAASEGLSYG